MHAAGLHTAGFGQKGRRIAKETGAMLGQSGLHTLRHAGSRQASRQTHGKRLTVWGLFGRKTIDQGIRRFTDECDRGLAGSNDCSCGDV